MVTGVSARTWSHSGDPRPLAQRYQIAAEKLIRLGGVAITPMSEIAVDQMNEEAEQLRKRKPEVWDPAVAAAGNEFERTVARYAQLFLNLRDNRIRLERLRSDGTHLILGDIGDELFELPPAPQQMIDDTFGRQPQPHPTMMIPGKLITPDFSSASEYKAATRAVLAAVHELENVAARAQSVFYFESICKDSQNRALILAQARQLAAQARQIAALEGRMRDLENQQSTKPTNKRRSA